MARREFIDEKAKPPSAVVVEVADDLLKRLEDGDFAAQADMGATSLGNRFAKLQRDVRAFAPSLPMPARLRGEPGSKIVELEPTFASAAAEVNL